MKLELHAIKTTFFRTSKTTQKKGETANDGEYMSQFVVI